MVGRFKNLMSRFSIFIYCWSREMTSVKFVGHELGLGHSSTVNLIIIYKKSVRGHFFNIQ